MSLHELTNNFFKYVDEIASRDPTFLKACEEILSGKDVNQVMIDVFKVDENELSKIPIEEVDKETDIQVIENSVMIINAVSNLEQKLNSDSS